jgi:hypothetical protein
LNGSLPTGSLGETHHERRRNVPREILFPEGELYYVFERDCLGFRALVDGKSVGCLVTGELLMHRFGASAFTEEAFREAYSKHEAEIHAIARHHIEMGWINSDNLVILTTLFTTLRFNYGEDLRKKPRELALAEAAARVLAELIGPGSREVTVDLDWEEKDGHRPFVVILNDPAGMAVSRFETKELEPVRRLRVRLARLWGDLLQIRSQKLIQQSG